VRGRAGHTLPELLVALFLAGIVGAAVIALFTSSTRAVRQLVVRSEQAETRRTVAALLLEELSVGVHGRDWRLDGDRAVSLRAFRGYARVCAWTPATSVLTVAWRGQRAPDPGRDSVLVLAAGAAGEATAPSAWVPADLAWVGAPPDPDACPLLDGERLAGWRVTGLDPSAALLLRYFEQGRYSLEDGAFRYRQGTAGRQPLTPEVVGRGSRIHPRAGTGSGLPGVEVELHLGEGAGDIDRWQVSGDPAGPWGRGLPGPSS
jgi:type II secretory pathway pseudopilin PulG